MTKCNARSLYMRKPMVQSVGKIWEYPLTVVEAPMGYGKTTAVKVVLEDSDATVLWQTVADESVNSFWAGFARLFSTVDPVCAASLAKLGAPENSVFLAEAINLIENVAFSGRTVIVIDDYHMLSSKHIDFFFETLVKMTLPNLHIVIISRFVFGDNMVELTLKGFCYGIGRSSFELSRSEIVEYYKLCGVRLNAQEASALYSYTEGWISALYLCLLSFLQDGRVEHQTSLHELVDRVVYRHCSEEIKDFLLTISAFDRFSLAQAAYMWQKEGVDSILRHLLDTNAFLTYDRSSKMYQMHNILTGYLRDVFERQNEKKQKAVWLTAGNWYIGIHDYIHAMECFYKADDFDRLLTALELDIGGSINNEHKEPLLRYFRECPGEMKRNHLRACLIYAINLFSFNEIELFAEQCREIGEYIEQIPAVNGALKKQWAGELELLYSFTKYNDIVGMSIHIKKASQLQERPAEFIDINGSWTFGSPSILYMFYRESGKLQQEVREMVEAMPCYCQITGGHGSGAEFVMQAERYYYIGEFENAEIMAHKAMYVAQSQKQLAIELCAMFIQIRLALARGDLSFVKSSLERSREAVKQAGLYAYLYTIDLCEAFVYACLKQVRKIPVWISTGNYQDACVFFPCYAYANTIYSKALLLSGQHLKLVGIAEQLVGIADVYSNLLAHIYTYIYEAAARLSLKAIQEAQIALKKAIDIAAPDQLVMPFVENGDSIMPICMELEKDIQYTAFVSKIQKMHPLFANNVMSMQAELGSRDGVALLTAREKEIALLVAAGLPNNDIAKKLYIAEVTVKKALQNMYAKLGINGRTSLAKLVAEQTRG